jgi:hypothetical protein
LFMIFVESKPKLITTPAAIICGLVICDMIYFVYYRY